MEVDHSQRPSSASALVEVGHPYIDTDGMTGVESVQ